uniref:Uncharacterized protein n=1 Tax=Arundo donax TaxID=35708 RepID=A0A0A8ZKR4_ARUDO
MKKNRILALGSSYNNNNKVFQS